MNRIAEYVMGIPLLTGLIFLVIASILYYYPPADIDSPIGYRTRRSTKNQEQWDFAQRFSSKRMIWGGLFLMVVSLTKLVFVFSVDTEGIIGLILVLWVTVYLIVATELAIKRKFPNK
jgi:uncharacterized membrane protein